jgi:hypothetical protein
MFCYFGGAEGRRMEAVKDGISDQLVLIWIELKRLRTL